eukprot:3032596-Lingulodinium_polyedra.AAC.1
MPIVSKRCTTTRSNRPSATTAARKSHAARTPREHQKWCSHGAREACGLRAAAAADNRFDRIFV